MPAETIPSASLLQGLRLLVAVANYGTKNDHYLARIIAEYRSMPCAVDMVVLSNIPKDFGAGVEVHVGLPTADPWSLPFGHQRIFADRLDAYDLFIYSEDDVLITQRNLEAFLQVQKVLPKSEIPGFIRYEEGSEGKLNFPDVHGSYHWEPSSVRSREPYRVAFFTNEHAACYVLTQAQLRSAIESGGYLVDAHRGRYDLLCSAATDPYTQCGFEKVVCISEMDEFLVHHLPNKYVGTRFGVGQEQFSSQLQALLALGTKEGAAGSLFQTETKLADCRYSKDYYEPANRAVLEAIPDGTRTILSVGCGWGSMETQLGKAGFHVSAVPLDAIIPGGAVSAGVEIIPGSLTEARRILGDRKFDCLLLSNVLHLVPHPIEVLSSYASLLEEGGSVVAVSPNMANLAAAWKSITRDRALTAWGPYESSGVHRVSRSVLRNWFRAAGLIAVKITGLHPRQSTKARAMASRLLGRWMATEFLVVAKLRSNPRVR